MESHIPAFARFEKYKGKDVLEVGCGIGTAAQSFMEAGATYTGRHYHHAALTSRECRVTMSTRVRIDGKFLVADVQKNDFVDGSFDLVYSFGVLHHIPNLDGALRNIRDVLKPGGGIQADDVRRGLLEKGVHRHSALISTRRNPAFPSRRRSQRRRSLEFYPHTLSTFVSEQDHIFQWNVSEYKNYRYEKEAWFEAMPDSLIRALEKRSVAPADHVPKTDDGVSVFLLHRVFRARPTDDYTLSGVVCALDSGDASTYTDR